MKPLLVALAPYLSEVPWGGAALQRRYGVDAPVDRRIGEAWVVSAVPGKASRVLADGRPLDALWRGSEAHFLGPATPVGAPFPLLVKLLATEAPLSVQVHPDDAAAQELEGAGPGKHEAWVVLDARDDAEILMDLEPESSVDRLVDAASRGDADAVRAQLVRVRPEPGDVFDVVPGTVHAPGAGLVLYEIQQPCDHTYRIFDWNRPGLDGRPRPLHIDKAHRAARRTRSSRRRLEGRAPRAVVLETPHWALERWCPADGACIPVTSMLAVTCVAGRGALVAGGEAPVALRPGASVLVARAASMVEVRGEGIELFVARPRRVV